MKPSMRQTALDHTSLSTQVHTEQCPSHGVVVQNKGVSGDAVTIAYNTTINLTCSATGRRSPDWFVNESEVVTSGDRYKVSTSNGRYKTATLTIDGNCTRDTLNIYCEVHVGGEQQFLTMHNTTLIIQVSNETVRVDPQIIQYTVYITDSYTGNSIVKENVTETQFTIFKMIIYLACPLPPPENVTISSQNSSTQLQWNPPYTMMNNESDVIHVDPHITQYTVYIFDVSNGSMIHSVNITETNFTPTHNIPLCPMYQVSAWNAGGEGNRSEPVQDSTPQVPRSIPNENITVAVTVVFLNISVHVVVVCTNRIPDFFLITLMTTTGRTFNETRQYQPEDTVTHFTIGLPQNVDVCSLRVRISAGNSAGMSAPSEAVEVGCSSGSRNRTIPTSITTATSTGSEIGGDEQQVSTILIVIIIGVIAVIAVVVIVAATVGIVVYKKHNRRNDSSTPKDISESKRPSVSEQLPLGNYYSRSPTQHEGHVPEVVYANPKQTTSADPRSQTQSSDSTTMAQRAITGAVESRHVVYAQLDFVQQTQVSPPANDDNPVQYAQIKQQD